MVRGKAIEDISAILISFCRTRALKLNIVDFHTIVEARSVAFYAI